MRTVLIIILVTCACIKLQAQVNIIVKIAGNDSAGYCCDGDSAVNAALNFPSQSCIDRFGNLYIADGLNQRIRKIVLATGIITTVAGDGTIGYSGDNGIATNAQLAIPEGVCTDTSGNIYIADGLTHRIRKVTVSTGIITTYAGNGISGNSGDGNLATNAEIQSPFELSFDKAGNLYIADVDNNNIRKVDANGIITTIAGNGTLGYTGDNGLAINATFSTPAMAIADNFGNIIISDGYNHAVRKVDVITGIITTIAGNGTPGYTGDSGPATNATVNYPVGIFIDKGNNIFFAEFGNGVIRKIDGSTGIISTVVGCGIQGITGDGGPATAAKLAPDDVFLDSFGTMYIADYGNQKIRMVYNPQLAVPNERVAKNSIKIFPNPAQNEINVEYHFANNEDGVFQLTDITGRIVAVKNLPFDKLTMTIDVGGLSPGLYLFKVVQSGVLISTGKIIKE